MNYKPYIIDATQVKRITLPSTRHTAILLDNIKSKGLIKYRYILAVHEREVDNPCLFVTSEVGVTDDVVKAGVYTLGLFPGNGHINLGASVDWGNIEKFEEKAVELANEYLQNNL